MPVGPAIRRRWHEPRRWIASHEYRGSWPPNGSKPGRPSSGRDVSVLFISSMPLIVGQPLWLVFALARAAGQRLRNSVSARSLRIAPAFGSREHPMASNQQSAKNDEARTGGSSRGERSATADERQPPAARPLGTEQRRRSDARGRIRTGDPRLVRAML